MEEDEHLNSLASDVQDIINAKDHDHRVLLPFQMEMLMQLIEADALCIMAQGLAWQQVVGVLLRLQEVQLQRSSQPNNGVVLVLGAAEWQREALKEVRDLVTNLLSYAHHMCTNQELRRLDPMLAARYNSTLQNASSTTAVGAVRSLTAAEAPADVTNEVPAAERLELYYSRATLFVTTRILVVDLLASRIRPRDIAGILVLNAHRVTDTSGEAFAVRLFRSGNQQGFVRAVSDAPLAFNVGFNKVEKVMKALYLRKLVLWPRYQLEVKEHLGQRPPELVEVCQPMTPSMANIADALLQLIGACIKDLQRSNKLDTTDLTLEHGVFKAFDEVVRRQLDPLWHTVSSRTKQAVSDLRTLRDLAERLVQFDAVTFLQYLENVRAVEGGRSTWMFHSAAHIVFAEARRRVYRVAYTPGLGEKRKRDGDHALGPDDGHQPSKQPSAQQQQQQQQQVQGSPSASSAGIEPVLEPLPKWNLLLEVMEEIQEARAAAASRLLQPAETDQQRAADEAVAAAPVVVFAQDAHTVAQLKEVLKAHGCTPLMTALYEHFLLQRLQGRRGPPAGGGRGSRGDGAPAPIRGKAPGEEQALDRHARQLAAKQGRRGRAPRAQPPPQEQQSPLLANVVLAAIDARDDMLLWRTQPAFVVLYDPSVALIRQVEVLKAYRPGLPLRVYMMTYEDSLQGDRLQAELERERRTFESLIRQKEFMLVPVTAAGEQLVQGQKTVTAADVGTNTRTRRAGGRASKPTPCRVVVDVREFMSSLPAVLHQQGMQLVPVQLEVGDYVLSPDMCVERKTLPDLRASFQSGRLFNQVDSMCRHYKTPVLLVEFDPDKAFLLNSPAEIGGNDIHGAALGSKLVLLVTHFPRLRIVWSRSLHATAEVFTMLKAIQDEPDPAAAAAIGLPVDAEGATQGLERVHNTAAHEVLRKLPGITDANVRNVLRECASLAELASLSMERMTGLLGGRAAAERLHRFLNQSPKALLEGLL